MAGKKGSKSARPGNGGAHRNAGRVERFIAEYPKDFNGHQAAIRAGYAAKWARNMASCLLKRPDVQAALAADAASRMAKVGLTTDRALAEAMRLAFSNIKAIFDADGNLVPIHTLPDDVAAAVASVEVVKKNLAAGDGFVDTVHKIKLWDKSKNLEMLFKHLGLLIERVEHSGSVDIVSVLKQRQERNRARSG
jgi:phage terminase small subunit